MNWGYLLGAVGLTAVFYAIGWAVINFLREEETPRIYFWTSVKRLFSDASLTGMERYLLGERLFSVVLLCCFSVVLYYNYWSTGGQLDLDQPAWIPFPALLLLSLFCTIPLMFWSIRVISFVALFTDGDFDMTNVHWLKWLRRLFTQKEQHGCLLRILSLVQFVVLFFQFFITYAFCYVILKIAFTA